VLQHYEVDQSDAFLVPAAKTGLPAATPLITKVPDGTFMMTGTLSQVQSTLQNLPGMMRQDPMGQDVLVTLTVRPTGYRMRAKSTPR